jgi:outer membrane protein TolC
LFLGGLGAALMPFREARTQAASTETPAAQAAVSSLDDLVQLALRDNPGQRQMRFGQDVADAARREAVGRWLPTATIGARYSQVSGNVVNLGALINPAFSALNGLLGAPAFPTNVDLRLPLTQETAVRVQQTLFAPAVGAGVSAAAAVQGMKRAEVSLHARTLAAQVRSGWLQWAKAERAVDVYASALTVLDEQARVTQRLVAEGVATPDAALRVKAERSAVVQQRDDAARMADAARQSVNMLLARPLDLALPAFADAALGIEPVPPLADATERAERRRDELRQLDAASAAARANERVVTSSYLPTLALAVDHGWQGNNYDFRASRDFTIASLVFSWNVFNGGQDGARAQQARLETARLGALRDQASRQVQLDVAVTHAAAAVAQRAIATARERVDAAERTWDLVRRRRESGGATLLEVLDARNALTAAQLNAVLTTYDYYLRCVDFDRAAARYPRTLP